MLLLKQRADIIVMLISVCFITACQKEIRESKSSVLANGSSLNASGNGNVAKRAFKASFSTWYRFQPINPPQPFQIDGTNYVGILNVPGGGEGHATHLGNAKTYFNQMAYVRPPDFSNVFGSVAAPVTAISSYTFTGAPLPLIQPGDFAGITEVLSSLNLAPSINGHIISTVIYNEKGDAFFISVKTGSQIIINGTTATTSGNSLIVGGSGKFVGATGEVNHAITFDVVNPNKASYTLDGWVMY